MAGGGKGSLAAARASASKKRRRSKGGDTSSSAKQRRASAEPELPATVPESVSTLEAQLEKEGIRGLNILLKLLTHVRPLNGEECVRAMHVVRRTISKHLQTTNLDLRIRTWLLERRSALNELLVGIIAVASDDKCSPEVVDNALAICALGGLKIWKSVVLLALSTPDNDRCLKTICECFVSRFADLRTHSLQAIIAMKASKFNGSKALQILDHCLEPPAFTTVHDSNNSDEKEAGGAEESAALRSLYGKAWLRLLGSKTLSLAETSGVLGRITVDVFPVVEDPLIFADYLTDYYNQEGSECINALDGLWYLVSKHGLDYPVFYVKLYQLLTPGALWGSDTNEKFLDHVSKFLSFGFNLPGALVAAFIKRLVRRATIAPPAAALWCLRLALDLLYTHKNVSYLVHRSISLFDSNDAAKAQLKNKYTGGADPFDDSQTDPHVCGADASSLWELEILQSHISPAVSRLVGTFSRDVRKDPLRPPGTVVDYIGLTFADVFETEFKRSKASPMGYDMPGCAPGVREVEADLGGVLVWE